MINLVKQPTYGSSKFKYSEIYCMSIDKYIHSASINGSKSNGRVVAICSKEDYEALKKLKFPTKEFTQVVLSSEEDELPLVIHQAMRKHVVYVNIVDHTR